MKTFHIFSNEERDIELKTAGKIADYIISKGGMCTYDAISRLLDFEIESNNIPDCVIVLGGDGSIIQVAAAAAKHGIPLLGINLGNLGYLAEVEKDNIFPAIDRLLSDKYEIEERMMLEADGHASLNDIVIIRSGRLRLIDYILTVNGKVLNEYGADGLIISTPTGSTGYNLSAGGPIVEPDAELILVTPICPHTLNSRTIVLSAKDEIQIEVRGGKYAEKSEACIYYDGLEAASLNGGDKVVIHKSDCVVKMIKLNKETFLDVLARKMNG